MRTLLFKLWNFWPPYLGAGIRIRRISPDFRAFDVEMKLRFWNKNYVGTQFGGSLYSMTDPYFMLILLWNLGREYIVWDKGAAIRFRRPGKGTVRAHFEISLEEIARIRAEADKNEKYEPVFRVDIVDEAGQVIAEVEKTLYVRRKDRAKKPE